MTANLYCFINAILEKQAVEEVLSNPSAILKRVVEVVTKNEIEAGFKYPEFNLDVEHHKKFNNEGSALYDEGCGCALCKARLVYCRAMRISHLYDVADNVEGFMLLFRRYYPNEVSNYIESFTTDSSSFYRKRHKDALEAYLKINQAYYDKGLHLKGVKLSSKIINRVNSPDMRIVEASAA